MNKVALVNPSSPLASTTAPPFNLMSLSTFIEDIADVKIIDEVAGQNVEDELISFQPNWVGIAVQTPCAYRAYNIAKFARGVLDCKIVLGGHHITSNQDESMRYADHIVVGEGEKVFRRLIAGEIKKPMIQGIPLVDLDEVPPLLWEEIDINFYIENNNSWLFGNQRTMCMVTSRGCPFRCIFCPNSMRSIPVRTHSATRVCLEVDRLMENYDVSCIVFADDEFLINKKRLSEMCTHFRNVGLKWGCQARATTITEEVADLISKSGNVWVGMGIESGNQRPLSILKANSATVKGNIEAIQILKKHGITVLGSFILGTPSETYEEMMDTINFIIEQQVDSASINSLTPYPSTVLWNMVGEKVKDVDYSRLIPSSNPSVILCDTMDEGDFKRVLQYASRVAKFKRGLCISKIRHRNRLKLFAEDPFYPYFLLRHPVTALRIIRKEFLN